MQPWSALNTGIWNYRHTTAEAEQKRAVAYSEKTFIKQSVNKYLKEKICGLFAAFCRDADGWDSRVGLKRTLSERSLTP